jgi:Leucine-rich repeat (LRR) protein
LEIIVGFCALSDRAETHHPLSFSCLINDGEIQNLNNNEADRRSVKSTSAVHWQPKLDRFRRLANLNKTLVYEVIGDCPINDGGNLVNNQFSTRSLILVSISFSSQEKTALSSTTTTASPVVVSMRFLARKQREEESPEQQPPPALLSTMTDEDSDYGPVPPPPPADDDEENMMPEKTDPPQDITQEMSMDHYQEGESNYLQQQTSRDEEDVRHEYDEEADNQKYIDDDTSVEIPPTEVVQRMLGNDEVECDLVDEKTSRGGFPLLLIAAVCCLGILAVVLGSGFGTGAFLRSKSSSSPAGGGEQTDGTSLGSISDKADGTSTTDSDRLNQVSTLLLTESKDQEILRDVSSAEYQAMKWLATDDPAQLNPETDTQRLVQRYVLASLFYQSDSVWKNAAGWMENADECQWSGVSCEAVDRNGARFNAVTRLDLQANGLSGGLPADLALLTNLKHLYLGGNAITQDMGAIQWTGMILEELSMLSNQLSGDISALGSIGGTLRVLDLGFNKFSGALPDLRSLLFLQDLRIQGNAFTGDIPDTLGALPLKRLYLGDNAWTEGPIPVFIYTMTQLETLSMPRAKRSQSISGAIGSLINLTLLDVAENTLTGTLPEQFLGMGTITEFTAQLNQLTGALPDFTTWRSLVTLDLAENDFTGALPDNIGDLVNLQMLRLSRNALSAAFPESTTSLVNLQVLDVSRNRMTGALPSDIGVMTNLRELNLSANLTPSISGFSGGLPDSIGNLKLLERLEIRSNAFTGAIPSSLQGLDAIKYLDLRFNGLTGTIPFEVSMLADTAKEAYFQGNRLEGAMPDGFCGVAVLETDCAMECSCCTMECPQQ